VTVINTASNISGPMAVLKPTIPVGNRPQGLAVTPNGKEVYVANSGSNSVSVIETVGNTVATTIPGVGPNPVGVAI
jgi:YVTN family beta-propeller protein